MESSKERNLFLGIDVGGTNIKVGLVDCGGVLIAKSSAATEPLRTPERVFRYAMDFANEHLTQAEVPGNILAGVGLAVPGVLDSRECVLREVVNLPGWLGQPLRRILTDVAQRTATVVNDANAAAYAEHTMRGLGDQSLALMTLGTGIGCGMVVAGNPHGGDNGCAGELGHIAIDFGPDAMPCTCGSRGHLETYAGSGGVIARMRMAIAHNDNNTAANIIDASSRLRREDATPRDIASAAELGNQLCQGVIDQTAIYIGQAIGMLGQVVDPAVVLLGGAMNFGGVETATGRGFLKTVQETVTKTTLVQVGGNINIEFASLGNDAGVLGAAMVAKQAYTK